MKIIFLDIDEVLNSITSAVANHALGTAEQFSELRLDMVSVGLLKLLCDRTGASIVITSSWRKKHTVKWFVTMFRRIGWADAPIIDKTVITAGGVRGVEIKMWLNKNPGVINYVILDDGDDILFSQRTKFVRTTQLDGFRLRHVLKALRVFGDFRDEDTSLQKHVDTKHLTEHR